MRSIRHLTSRICLLLVLFDVSAARAADPIPASIEIDAGTKPGTMSITWSLQGPHDMPMFTVDPAKLRVTYRRIGSTTTVRAIPESSAPFAASSITMTNYDAVTAFVQFDEATVAPGTYVVDADATDAIAWEKTAGNVSLKLPSTYVYVSNVAIANQPDAEIEALTRAYAARKAGVHMPFVVACQDAGMQSVLAGSLLDVTGFARTASRQTGNGPNAVHAVDPAGPNGVGETANQFVSVAAIDVTFANVSVKSKAPCKVASIPFASQADVRRYLRPMTH